MCTSCREENMWEHFHTPQRFMLCSCSADLLTKSKPLKFSGRFSSHKPNKINNGLISPTYMHVLLSGVILSNPCKLPVTLSPLFHVDERPNKSYSSIPAGLLPHALLHLPELITPATAPAVCSCERKTCPGSVTSTGSFRGCRLH